MILKTTLDKELAAEYGIDGLAACPMMKAGDAFNVDKLEEVGLVRRMQSEDDARSVVVVLTAEGESLRGSFAAISKKLASRVYSPLSKDEGEMLEKLLNKVLSNLEAAKNAESAKSD